METTNKRQVKLGTREVDFPSKQLQQLQPDNDCLGDQAALRSRIQDKGYLFLKGLHDRDEVLDARMAVLEYIQGTGEGKFVADVPLQQGILNQRCGRGCVPLMEGKNNITHNDFVAKVLEGNRPKEFFHCFLGEESLTFDYKWLRGVYHEGFTGAHVDNVYMGRGTRELYTMWTPFDDVPVEMGTLTMCEGSHRLPAFKHFQETYGNFDVEENNLDDTGWFTEDPFEITKKFGGIWKTSDFQAGDVLIFTMRTIHMSTVNLTNRVRISCDTRWQPKSHEADPRYVGEFDAEPKKLRGDWAKKSDAQESKEYLTIEKLKKIWGFL